jgi:hypothetical protein
MSAAERQQAILEAQERNTQPFEGPLDENGGGLTPTPTDTSNPSAKPSHGELGAAQAEAASVVETPSDPVGSAQPEPVEAPPSAPVPATFAEIRSQLPKDEAGNPDFQALTRAIESVAGQNIPWAKLPQEQKQAAWDQLHGTSPTASAAAPIPASQAAPVVKPDIGGPITTPGTRVEWSNVKEWLDRANEIGNRRSSAAQHKAAAEHFEELARNIERIVKASEDLAELKRLDQYLNKVETMLGVKPGAMPHRGARGGTTWEKVNEAVKGRISQIEAQAAKPKKVRSDNRQPGTLAEHIMKFGGLAPHTELKMRDLHTYFRPGWGRMVRKGGMDLDKARELAIDLGYLRDAEHGSRATVDDLLNLLEDEARGKRALTEQEQNYQQDEEQDPAERDAEIRNAILDTLDEMGLPNDEVDPEALKLASDIVARGESNLADAYEAAIRQLAETYPDVASEMEAADIPFFEDHDEVTAEQPTGSDPFQDPQEGERVDERAAEEEGAAASPGERDASAGAGQDGARESDDALDPEIYDDLQAVRSKHRMVEAPARKRLVDLGYAKGGTKLKLTEEGQRALAAEFQRRQEAERDPIAEDLIERGLMSSYQDTINLVSPPYFDGKMKAGPWPVQWPNSRLFQFGLNYVRKPGGGYVYVNHPKLADDPGVQAWLKDAGLELQEKEDGDRGASISNTWAHAVDLANDKDWQDLAASQEFTTPEAIARAVSIRLMSSGKHSPNLSTENARKLLDAADIPDPGLPQAVQDLFEHADIKPRTGDKGQSIPGSYFFNFHIGNKRDDLAVLQREAFAFVHGHEQGFLKYDRQGHVQPTQKLLDLQSGDLDLEKAKGAKGEAESESLKGTAKALSDGQREFGPFTIDVQTTRAGGDPMWSARISKNGTFLTTQHSFAGGTKEHFFGVVLGPYIDALLKRDAEMVKAPQGYEVDQARPLNKREAELKGGQFVAVGRRLAPWSVENGYGDTPEDAQRDALRRVGAPGFAPTTEKGADGKPQTVIPGAEKDEAGLAQAKADAPLKPKAPQKDTDGLALFGDQRNQTDLFDAPAAASEFPKTETDVKPAPESASLADAFVERLRGDGFRSILEARKFAKELGVEDPKVVEEQLELAVVKAARAIVAEPAGPDGPKGKFDDLVRLYGHQPTLGTRTSTSMLQQAYSTPIPLAYVASRLAGITVNTTVYEPSAGNGALLIEASPHLAVVNELNPARAENLRSQGFPEVTEQDAVTHEAPNVSVVIANPPFGVVRDEIGEAKVFDLSDIQPGYKTKEIDHAIALRSLEALGSNGRAVLIIGSVNPQKDRRDGYNGKAKREFFLTLFKNYNVVDHFTVAGDLYKKQGAGWPVDVIVIDGRGKSERPLPAVQAPPVLSSWEELKGKLDAQREGTDRDEARGAADGASAERPERGAGRDRVGSRGERPAQLQPAAGEPAGVRPQRDPGQPGSAPDAGRREQGEERPESGQPERAGAAPAVKRAPETTETATQATYTPASKKAAGLGTLVPVNMKGSVQEALKGAESRRGDLDAYVAKKLGYAIEELPAYFGAEQVDALALAFDNIEKGRGFIIGDQTGIGKGRVNAAIIRYAIKQGLPPIFVTEKPNLYADMYRDLSDIGIQKMLGREPRILATNADLDFALDEAGTYRLETGGSKKHNELLRDLAGTGSIGDFDIVFTTYNQMQTVKGEGTDRQAFLDAVSPSAVLILDESHNAGGNAGKRDNRAAKLASHAKKVEKAIRKGETPPPAPGMGAMDRAEFVRKLVRKSKSTFYSSATYAKRPDVMDLYSKTDMSLAVKEPSELGDAIAAGGVPLQQVVAAMLAEAGQYVRRERSFAGVVYEPVVTPVDTKVYDDFSKALAMVLRFSQLVKKSSDEIGQKLRGEGMAVGGDQAVGQAGANSMNFTSVMHNLINQMLLAINAKPAADQAIARIRAGEKPVIALASTNESFLAEYAENVGLQTGDVIDLDFTAMLERYLERTRWISIRRPFMEAGEAAEKHRLTDEELGPAGRAAFKQAQEFLANTDFSALPASPIDFIRGEIKKAGYKVGEITGRNMVVDYSDGLKTLATRPGKERSIAGRREQISQFNDGRLDAIILNQSGATGLSLHASEKFKDQRPRHMIIAQAEGNVDTHMQMLGRVHRTGQVELPSYSQLIPDIPASKRPAAVLAKKMASLNANTTASRKSALTAENVPDFMNEYGDRIAYLVMMDEVELNAAMDYPVEPSDKPIVEGAMRKVTGRIPLLPLKEQERLYKRLEDEYRHYVEQLEAEGKNALEAKTIPLDAKPVQVLELDAQAGDSPFARGVTLTLYDVKRQGKPYTVEEMVADLAANMGLERGALPEDHAKAIAAAETRGRQHAEQLASTALQGFAEFEQRFLGRMTDPEKISQNQKRLTEQKDSFERVMEFAYPGNRVRLRFSDAESVTGLVLKLTPAPDDATNPIAPGQWRVKVAVPTGARTMDFNFTRLVVGRDPEGDQVAIEHAGWSEPIESTVRLFDMASKADVREKRVIAEGNLLKAFAGVGKGGRIINFETADGQIRPGIMLKEKVQSIKDAMKGRREPMTWAQAAKWLEDNPGTPLTSTDGYVTLTDSGRGYVMVSVAKARDKGGRYYLDSGVLDAMGKDFYSRGSHMRADVASRKILVLTEALEKAGAKFAKDVDVDELGPGAPPTQAQAAARSPSLKGTEIDVERGLFDALGLKPARFWADYTALAAKHPDHFPTALDAKFHVERVLSRPDLAIPQRSGNIDLVARTDEGDRLVGIKVQIKNGRYHVATAYRLDPGQLERMREGAARAGATVVELSSTDHWSGREPGSDNSTDGLGGKDGPGSAQLEDRWTIKQQLDSLLDGLRKDPVSARKLLADPDLARRLSQVILMEVKQRTIGDHVALRFSNDLQASDRSFANSAGGRTDPTLEVIAQYTAHRLITLGSKADVESIHHEVFHALQHLGAFTEQELDLLDRERERNRAFLARKHGVPLEEATYSADEVDAYTYGLFAYAIEHNAPGEAVGIHIGLRRLFARVRDVVRRLINLLNGAGFQISEDLFRRVMSGEMRERLDQVRRGEREPGFGYGPLWEWQGLTDELAQRAAGEGGDALSPSELWRLSQTAALSPDRLTRYHVKAGTFSSETIQDVKDRNDAAGLPQAAAAPAPSFPTPRETRTDKVRAVQQDSFAYLERVQRVIEDTRGAPLAEPVDAYLAQVLFPGKRNDRIKRFRDDVVAPLLKAIAASKLSTDDIGLYLIARHAKERNALMAQRDPKNFAVDGGSGMSDQVAQDYLNEFARDGKTADLERIAQRVYAIVKMDTDNRHAAGLISDETRDHWDNLFPSGRYVPLRGFAERDEDHGDSHYGRGFDIRGREAKQATGRTSLSDNPLHAVIHMAEEGIIRAEKNAAGKALLRLVRQNPNPEVWSVIRNPTRKYIDEATGLVRIAPDNFAKSRDNVLAVKVGGTPYYIELTNENLAYAYRNMGGPNFGAVTENVGKLTRLFASLQTGRNPEFFIPNFTRDVQEAALTLSAVDAKLLPTFLKMIAGPAPTAASRKAAGISAGAKWDAIFDEWARHGGRIDHFAMRDLVQIHSEIQKTVGELDQHALQRLPKELVRKLFGAIDGVNEAFENATRLAVYAAARQHGYSPNRAAALARESTINFGRRGRASAWVNAYYAFYNAAVQGNYKSVALLRKSKLVRAAYVGMTALGFTMALVARTFFGNDDDDPEKKRPWDFIPDYEKRSNIIIPYGTVKDGQGNVTLNYVKIPLAFGFKIPYYLGVQAAELVMGTTTPGKAALDVFTNTLDAFNPLGDGQLLTMAFPTLAKPVAELLTNTDWRGREIYPEKERWNEGLPRSSQPTNSATNPAAILVTEKLNALTGGNKYEPGLVDWYPGAVEHAVMWTVGGAGRFVANSWHTGSNLVQGVPTPIEKWPIARRFVGETGPQGEAAVYYERRGQIQEHRNRYTQAKRAVEENPDNEEARTVLEREADFLGVTPNVKKRASWKHSNINAFEKADDDIRSLRQTKQAVRSDPTLTVLEKHRRVEAIDREIWAIQRGARGEGPKIPGEGLSAR